MTDFSSTQCLCTVLSVNKEKTEDQGLPIATTPEYKSESSGGSYNPFGGTFYSCYYFVFTDASV